MAPNMDPPKVAKPSAVTVALALGIDAKRSLTLAAPKARIEHSIRLIPRAQKCGSMGPDGRWLGH